MERFQPKALVVGALTRARKITNSLYLLVSSQRSNALISVESRDVSGVAVISGFYFRTDGADTIFWDRGYVWTRGRFFWKKNVVIGFDTKYEGGGKALYLYWVENSIILFKTYDPNTIAKPGVHTIATYRGGGHLTLTAEQR